MKLSKIRKLTGSHMVMSKGLSPHAFSVVEVDYANVDATRSKVKASWKANEGFSLTYLPFITRAVVDALADFPHLNASVSDNDLVVHHFIDIGIAVDLEFQGLLVPVVRAAETKRLRAIAKEIMVATFSPMDLLFYGIAVYEGYRLSFRRLTRDDLAAALSQQSGSQHSA